MLGIAEWVNKCINEWNNLLGLYYISWTMLIINKKWRLWRLWKLYEVFTLYRGLILEKKKLQTLENVWNIP